MSTRLPPRDYYSIELPTVHYRHLSYRSWQRLDGENETAGGVLGLGLQYGLSAVVTQDSPLPLRKAVECIAYYFRREFHYDFAPYAAKDDGGDDGHRAYVWTRDGRRDLEKNIVIGACCFRRRKYSSGLPAGIPNEIFALQWMWLHPYERRKGLLSKAWPYFIARFDPFVPERPFSKAMDDFLMKVNYHPNQKWPGLSE